MTVMAATSGRIVRTAATTLLAGLWLVLLAAPALAHAGGGSDATNYRSAVVDVRPPAAGVSWRVLAGDALLQVVNRTGEELTVSGYQGEPYLRVGPDGVFENRNSPAAYLNNDRLAQTPVPETADPRAEPAWVRVGDRPTFAWHDHRIHWMASTLPPQVQADPNQPVLVNAWQVPFTLAGREAVVAGELRWVPGPVWWPWPLAAGLLALAPVMLAVRRASGEQRRRAALRSAALVLAAVAVLDVLHTVDDLVAVPATVAENITAGLQAGLFIAVAFFGAWRAWRAGDGAATALLVGAAALTVGIGLLHLATLTRSQVASMLPAWVARAVTAANLVLPLPAVAAAVISGDFSAHSENEDRATEPAAAAEG